jgi:DNA (cytosine-5)-methyltransferase 1
VARRPGDAAFTFVDLFAGIGGFRLGLEAVNGICVYSVEKDKFARQSYEANFDEPRGNDIRDVEALPPHDLMAAGFPCQPFSLAGVSKKVSLGRDHGFLDKTHGTLFFEVARLIGSSRPAILLLENVKHLLRHDTGATYAVIKGTLEELGYNVTESIIDARPWVPQHRERLIIVGLRRSLFGGKHFEFPASPVSSPTLRSILEARYHRKYVLSAHLWTYLRGYAEKHRAAGNGFGYGLCGADDVARTLSARYHKDGSEILIRTGGDRPRRLTPRECARLMGFPETFEIICSDTQAYRQFGNAVVVPVVAHVARALLQQVSLAGASAKAS